MPPIILPTAWARAVERLLASPHYGERWGKYWLDVAGYADSNGYFNADTDRPLAYRYRDYVIRSFNDDKPFDRFVREQLAGDELSGYRGRHSHVDETVIELLTATHFLRNAQDGTSESDGNPDEVRIDRARCSKGPCRSSMNSLLGPHHSMLPLPRSQVRADRAARVLPACRPSSIRRFRRLTKSRGSSRETASHTSTTPDELSRWEAETRQLDEEIAGLKCTICRLGAKDIVPPTWFASTTISTRPGDIAGSEMVEPCPGDDAPAGTPEIQLDAASAPAAFVRNGELRLVESGSPAIAGCARKTSSTGLPLKRGNGFKPRST